MTDEQLTKMDLDILVQVLKQARAVVGALNDPTTVAKLSDKQCSDLDAVEKEVTELAFEVGLLSFKIISR